MIPAPTWFPTLVVPWAQSVVTAAYVLVQLLLVIYSSHRYLILWRWWRAKPGKAGRSASAGSARRWPSVTVQLPVFNERLVVERLIEAAAALDYPRHRFEIQVLDDSTDETRTIAARTIERLRDRGTRIAHLTRPQRRGFKAGALAEGLRRAGGDLVAIFDADFVPPPDFLRRLVPLLDDPTVGMVQARWEHLNRSRSGLTAAQAVMLDSHFLIEHTSRMRHGLFFNFNGTAGIWRRACIEDAGGWSDDTLTEDLDLSYRAQLRGWRFGFDPAISSPAELPADMEALKSQQRRWAKGSIQTARKLLPVLFATRQPPGVKLESFFHLTSNAAYPLLLTLALLLAPVLLMPSPLPQWLVWTIQIAVTGFGALPVLLFLAAGQRSAGARGAAIARDVALALVLGVGLSLNNARAVLEGLGSRVGTWERTPKSGDGGRASRTAVYVSASRWAGAGEIGLALYFAGLTAFAWREGEIRALPFLALLLVGFAAVGIGSLRSPRARSGR